MIEGIIDRGVKQKKIHGLMRKTKSRSSRLNRPSDKMAHTASLYQERCSGAVKFSSHGHSCDYFLMMHFLVTVYSPALSLMK